MCDRLDHSIHVPIPPLPLHTQEGVHVFTVDAQWEGLEAVWRRLEAHPEEAARVAAANAQLAELLTGACVGAGTVVQIHVKLCVGVS